MPGNTVLINGSKDFEWYVGDSKMEGLIKYLDEIGLREKKEVKEVKKVKIPLRVEWYDSKDH